MTLLFYCMLIFVGYGFNFWVGYLVGQRRTKALRRLLLETIEENNNLRLELIELDNN